MHSLIASLICSVLLLTVGRTKSEEEFQYQQNVPDEAKNALLEAINEQRKFLPESLRTIVYDEGLAKMAHEEVSGGFLGAWQGRSTFEDTWTETFRRALNNSSSRGKINVAKTIGCEITLATSNSDGSHNVELDCRLGDENGNLLKTNSNVAHE